jgi:hypothetical protein
MIKINLQFFGGRGTGSYTAGGASVGMAGAMGGDGADMNVAGWTPDAGSRSVDKNNTIKGVENRIRNLDHEQLAIIDKNGYVVAAVDGGEHSVGITANAAKHIKGNDVYHNHPNGSTLSTTDVITAGQTGCGSISAVSKNSGKTYTLKAGHKANGAGLSSAMQKSEGKLIGQWQAKIDSMKGKKYKSEASWKKQVNKHWENIMGDWMKNNASKYGYTYIVK